LPALQKVPEVLARGLESAHPEISTLSGREKDYPLDKKEASAQSETG